MNEERLTAISDAEREVLKALWDHGPGTVRQVHDLLKGRGQAWTRSTVITLLQRLEKKGYARSDRSGFAFIFRAATSREDVGRQRLQAVAEELYQGEAAPLVLAFAEQHDFSEDEVAQFRKMIEQHEAKARRRRPER